MKKNIIYITLFLILAALTLVLSGVSALGAEEDEFSSLPIVFVASKTRGNGSGISPENAIGNVTDYDELLANKSGDAYKLSALSEAYGRIGMTGGTIVVCEPITVECADAIRSTSPAEFNLPLENSDKSFKLTSVFNGVDYAEKNGAKIILDTVACKSVGLNFRAKQVIENITIEYKYDTGNGWFTKENTTVLLAFGGYKSVVGEGVKVISSPAAGAVEGRYPTLVAGHRYSNVRSTDLTVKSGTWSSVIAGGYGYKSEYPAKVSGNARLDIQGGTIDAVYGEGANDPGRGKFARIEGALEIFITGNAKVSFANGSPTNEDSANKELIYSPDCINPEKVKNFENVTKDGETRPQSAPAPVIVDLVTPDSITLIKVEGVEYSLDGINWQTENTFGALTPGTKYTVYARKAAVPGFFPSGSVTSEITTETADLTDAAFEGKPVVYIASAPSGNGDGSSPENALGNASDYASLVASQNSTAYQKNALHLGMMKLKETGGTLVICGELTLDSADVFRQTPAEFQTTDKYGDVPGTFTDPIRITSVYGENDFRSSGANLILDQNACQSLNVLFKGPVLIDNITLDFVYSSGTTWDPGEKATIYIEFNGYKSGIGEGVKVNSVPVEGGAPGRLPTLIAGHRTKASIDSTNLTVRSGDWEAIICGSHGNGESNAGEVAGNAKVAVLGGSVKVLYGEQYYNSSKCKYARINGELTVLIGDKASVGTADGSLLSKRADGKTVYYSPEAVEENDILNFANIIPVTGFEESSDTFLSYKEKDGEAVITGITDRRFSGKITLPEFIDGLPVVGIEDGAFDGVSGITLRGKTGSFAEEYAEANSVPFESTGILIIYGDVNDDKKVNVSDVVRLKRYFAEYDYLSNESTVVIGEGADANGDGKVTSLDVIRLKKYFAGFDYATGRSDVPLGKPQSGYTRKKTPDKSKRDIVYDYMVSMSEVVWTATNDIDTTDIAKTLKYSAGEEYHGLPYINYDVDTDLEEFLEVLRFDEASGKYFYDETVRKNILGNDCSSAVLLSWKRLDGGISATTTHDMFPLGSSTGVYALGGITDDGIDVTSAIIYNTGDTAYYEALALLRKGDAVLTHSSTGHVRMVVDAPVVVRSAGGVIDPYNSYITCLEQTNSMDKTRTDGVKTTWYVNHTYTFSQLRNSGYIPISCAALMTDRFEPYPGLKITSKGVTAADSLPAATYLEGRIISNYSIQKATVSVENPDGNAVFTESYKPLSYTFDLGNVFYTLDPASLPSGEYTFKVTLLTACGEDEALNVVFTK